MTLSSWWGELCHQIENSLDLGWTAGATSKVRHFWITGKCRQPVNRSMVPTAFPKTKAILLEASRKSDGDKHSANHRCESSLVLLTLQRSSYKHKELRHCLLETTRCSCRVEDACIRELHSALASAFQAPCRGVGFVCCWHEGSGWSGVQVLCCTFWSPTVWIYCSNACVLCVVP